MTEKNAGRHEAGQANPTPAEPAIQSGASDLILFDGYCHLCSWIVKFVIARDRKRRYRFAPLDSAIGRFYAADEERCRDAIGSDGGLNPEARRAGISDRDRPLSAFDADRSGGSFKLVRGGRVYTKSRAALEVIRTLSGAWPLLYLLIVIPPPIRDRIYDWIARNRYRWFGASESCALSTPDIADRFVE
jgi:predicted DCC family thiol-disulfide oxidoreductase YuxK